MNASEAIDKVLEQAQLSIVSIWADDYKVLVDNLKSDESIYKTFLDEFVDPTDSAISQHSFSELESTMNKNLQELSTLTEYTEVKKS